jgi:hypothetical protein
MTVHNLRLSGYKVRVLHCRVFDNRTLGKVYPKGGETVVQITTPDGQDLEGRAKCSKKDCYNKRLGVKVAIGRALFRECA